MAPDMVAEYGAHVVQLQQVKRVFAVRDGDRNTRGTLDTLKHARLHLGTG